MKNLLKWTPRILAILLILFFSVFAMDVFEGGGSLGSKLMGFFIHLIPALLILIALIIAWKYSHIGGLLFILAAIIFSVWFGTYKDLVAFMTLSVPPLIIGLLFLWQWKKK